MPRPDLRIVILAIMTTMLASACRHMETEPLTSSGSAGSAALQLYLTDAPSDFMDSAEVTISRAYLMPGRVDLLDPSADPLLFDLLELQDGIQALLSDSLLPPATYNQLRLVVDSAEITLAEPYRYDDGSTTKAIRIGSGRQTGIKVALDEPIEAAEGTVTMMVVDFDVNESFVMQGDPAGPQGIRGWVFVPVIVETDRSRTTLEPAP